MQAAPLPDDEYERLNELYNYHVLDTAAENAFNEVVALAAEICEVPIALISLVDEARQWFKAKIGLDVDQTERSISFCAHAILQNDVFMINDTLKDKRFLDNPLVTDSPKIRFYAGAPLITEDGHGLGTLCVIDKEPRQLNVSQIKALRVLRTHVMTLLQMRKQTFQITMLNQELDAFSAAASHDLIAPTRRLAGFSQILLDDFADKLNEEAIDIITRMKYSAIDMKQLIEGLLDMSRITRTEINYAHIDLSKMIESFSKELMQSTERVVDLDIEPNVQVYADPTLIRIVVQNLLKNAWKFTANCDVTRIRFYSKLQNGHRWFNIEDNGAGFDMRYIDKLFIPFQRLHRQEDFRGSGIGLATVQRIIHRHGGKVTITSQLNQGTKVSFTLG